MMNASCADFFVGNLNVYFCTIEVDTIHIPSLSKYLTEKTWLPK